MLIQSLVKYYNILADSGFDIVRGYTKATVQHTLDLDIEGNLVAITPFGEKTDLVVPEQFKRSSRPKANFLMDNLGYLLGYAKSEDEIEWARNCFELSWKLHNDILSTCMDPVAHAILAFFEKWSDKDSHFINSFVMSHLTEMQIWGNGTFRVNDTYPTDIKEIRTSWEKYQYQTQSNINRVCPVSGVNLPVAILHPTIKGIIGSPPTGTSLISYNNESFCSYGYDGEKGLNAGVSEFSTFAYSTALSYLLSEKETHKYYYGSTIVFWADSSNVSYQHVFSHFIDPIADTEDPLCKSFDRMLSGSLFSEVFPQLDPSMTFHILALSANSARISISMYYQSTFEELVQNLVAHQKAMLIGSHPNLITFNQLIAQVRPTHSRNPLVPKSLTSSILLAICQKKPYPHLLLQTVLQRIMQQRSLTREQACILQAFWSTVDCGSTRSTEIKQQGQALALVDIILQELNIYRRLTMLERYFALVVARPFQIIPLLIEKTKWEIPKFTDYPLGNYYLKKLNNYTSDQVSNQCLSPTEQVIFLLEYYNSRLAHYSVSKKEGTYV